MTDNPDGGSDADTSDDRGSTASDRVVNADRPPALLPPEQPAGALPSPVSIDPATRGLPPRDRTAETVLYDLVAAYRGAISQIELRNRTTYAPTTVSNNLRSLEEQGRIVKRQYGKTNLIQLADDDEEADTSGVSVPRRP